jgi:hypothetical protein
MNERELREAEHLALKQIYSQTVPNEEPSNENMERLERVAAQLEAAGIKPWLVTQDLVRFFTIRMVHKS